MENSTSNNQTDTQKLQNLYIKEKFQRAIIQELLNNIQKLIESYEQLLQQLKLSSSLEPEFKSLNSHITKIFYSDINTRKHSIKRIRNDFKGFKKVYDRTR